jgi:5'-phosphate synthase pdxT subunit
MIVGVLTLQGAVSEHLVALKKLGVIANPVKTQEELSEIDGLIIPGGESTTIGRLIQRFNLEQVIKERIENGMPVYGTCAGMILLAKNIEGSDQYRLNVLDITIVRNAFGRQIDSKEIDLDIKGFESPFHAVFIRAPIAKDVSQNVLILSSVPEGIVFLRQGNVLVSSFHPELTNDLRVHKLFIDMINSYNQNRR